MKKGMIPGLAVLLLLVLGGWWARDTRVDLSWEPEWPRALRISAVGVESLRPGADGEVSDGDRARAVERARWKAYYYAQLRTAERIRGLAVDAETTIDDLGEMSQELRASMAGTVAAAREIPGEETVEILDDAVRVRVVVEVAETSLGDFRRALRVLLAAGKVRIERRPRVVGPPPVEVARAVPAVGSPAAGKPAPGPGPKSPSKPPSRSSAAPPVPTELVPTEVVPVSRRSAAVDPPAETTLRPPRRVRPQGTGAVIFVAHGSGHLGAAPWIYDAGGTELGSALDLPPQRLAAGFRLTSAGDAEGIHRVVGPEPRRYQAGVSMGDLFLEEKLDSEDARRFKTWLAEDRLVLVLGDPEA